MRIFAAVWPTREVFDALAGLDCPVNPLVRWTTPEQRHVTLRFFGEVLDDDVPRVLDALRSVGERLRPFRAELGPSTTRFGRSTLVVPVSGLDELVDAVVEATRSFGDPPPNRIFAGHLTLARARRDRPVPADLAGQAVSASWLVDEVVLVRSHLDPDGLRYETLAAVPLASL